MNAEAGQAEEDKEQLHNERRVADQLHIHGVDREQHGQFPGARDGAKNTDGNTEYGANECQAQGADHAGVQVLAIFPNTAEIKSVCHGALDPVTAGL